MKKAFSILLLLGGIFMAWRWFGSANRVFLSPAEILGGVVRTDEPAGGRLYYLTSQWEKRVSRIGARASSSLRTVSSLNVDLWALDAATAQPVLRRRIKQAQVNADSKALGMEQGVLWARIPELVGIRLVDGVVVADRAKIEARNPGLVGLMPKPPQATFFLTNEMQPLKFDPQAGMIVRLDDARVVRIDPLTLEATPHVARPEGEKLAQAAGNPTPRMKVISPSNGMDWSAMVRGLAMPRPDGGGEWLGLLAETELETMRTSRFVGHHMDFTVPRRQRLYRAEIRQVTGVFETRGNYHDPTALPESPEFLMGGLLAEAATDSSERSALWRRDPDSVFVLSRDRLGDDGRLQIARVSGPKGAAVWSAALSLSDLGAWIPGERHALILGPNPTAPRSPMAEENENPVMQILSVDLVTGGLNSFNPDLHRDWPLDRTPEKAP